MGDHNGSYSAGEDESPFFADITLDLAEAHDIAETPEPSRKALIGGEYGNMPRMPSIPANDPLVSSSKSLPASPYIKQNNSIPDPVQEDDDTDEQFTGESRNFVSITSDSAQGNHEKANSTGNLHSAHNHRNRMTPSSRRWPRDVEWAVGFCILVPLSLLLPILFSRGPAPPKHGSNPTENWLSTAPAPRLATLHTLLWGYAAALVLSRLLYRTMGGGDGDDARHFASQILLVSAPVSVSVYIMIIVTIFFMVPQGLWFTVIPLWYLARDLFLFRSWKITATTPGGRQAFFQALTCMTLDILSRSLRRSSFYRIVSLLLVIQLFVIAWWRMALLAALRSHSIFLILLAVVGGKWATGTVARLLTLIASGGVSSWFAEQNALVEGLHQHQQEQQQQNSESNGHDTYLNGDYPNDNDEMIEFAALNSRNNHVTSTYRDDGGDIPEEYRTVDASIYKSALVPDEGMDDDFEDEEENLSSNQTSWIATATGTQRSTIRGSTVKQLLFSGLSISFGSVAKCGLLGGLAQFVWSQLRKIDTARATFRNLQGMSVGTTTNEQDNLLNRFLLHSNIFSREFVRNNSDMAMSHVAAFQKSYQRAAQDVAILIDESGTSGILMSMNNR